MRQSGFMRARARGANGRRGGKGRGFSGAVLTGGKRAFRLFPVLLAAVAFAAPVIAGDSSPAEWRVVDGDTIARGDERVRFCAVDTPERGKPGAAAAATGVMRGLLRGAGGTVWVVAVGADRFGRTVARVFIGEVDAQVFLLAAGLARIHPRFADACAPAGLSAAELRAAAKPSAGGR